MVLFALTFHIKEKVISQGLMESGNTFFSIQCTKFKIVYPEYLDRPAQKA